MLRLDFRERLLLPLDQVGDLGLEMALRALEIVGDSLQPLVEPALDLGERVGERFAGSPLALGERRAPLLSEPALLGGELRDRVGPLTREGSADLLGVRGRLLGDRCSDAGSRLGDELRRGRPRSCAPGGARARGRARAASATARDAARIQTITPERYRCRATSAAAMRRAGDREQPERALGRGDEQLAGDGLSTAG